MIQRIFNGLLAVFVLAGLLASPVVSAKSVRYKPFVLAYQGSGDIDSKKAEVTGALESAGFDVVGEYTPYADTTILVITSEELKKKAVKNKGGAYSAAQRVSIVKRNGELQVAYTNPVYMAHAYRMKDDMQDVSDALAKAIGRIKEFGSRRGLKKRKLRKYHYTFGMEYFDEPYELGEFSSHAAAVKAVENGLAAGKGGVTKVARIDMPGQTLFSVALQSKTDKYANDKYVMGIIDFGKLSGAAHLPYEILVKGNEVFALHARFRIAMDFPDLSMMGEKSFMKIMESPAAYEKAFLEVTGK